MRRLTAGIPAKRARCVAEVRPSRPRGRVFWLFSPLFEAALCALFASRTGSLPSGDFRIFARGQVKVDFSGRSPHLFQGSRNLGDRPWRLSSEKVCAIRGDPRGERLHWNVFFLLVNARARPMREEKR